jgi:hypothetical protein
MKDRTVEYMSMDHYMKSEKMKKKSAKMAEMGMPTCATPGKTNEEVQEREQKMREGYGYFTM